MRADSDTRIVALLEGLRLETLVPAAYARYALALRDVLAAFLAKLPPEHLARIIDAQAALPPRAGPAERLVSLVHFCPTLHKLAQVIARHRALAPSLRHQLQQLETMVPRTAMHDLRRVLRQELGDRFDAVSLGAHAIAEASVAVVVSFDWLDPKDRDKPGGVFKVLKPGVAETLSCELAIWTELGALLDEACEQYGLPPLDYRETLEQMRDLLRMEIRLEHEQAHLADAADAYAGFDRVTIPSLLPLCTSKVTAMTRLEGRKVTEVGSSPPQTRHALAGLVVQALIAHPFQSAEPAALFHADPHAGNLVATDDGRLGILDWSLTGRLGSHQRELIAQIVLAALTLDAAHVCRPITRLAANQPDAAKLRDVVDRALAHVRAGAVPGLHWMVRLLDAAVTAAGVRFGTDMLLFRKCLLTLDGVVADVYPGASADRFLLPAAIERLASEWPRRLLSPPASRAYPTHVSNLDLAWFAMSVPAGFWRFWPGLSLDWFESLTDWRRLRPTGSGFSPFAP